MAKAKKEVTELSPKEGTVSDRIYIELQRLNKEASELKIDIPDDAKELFNVLDSGEELKPENVDYALQVLVTFEALIKSQYKNVVESEPTQEELDLAEDETFRDFIAKAKELYEVKRDRYKYQKQFKLYAYYTKVLSDFHREMLRLEGTRAVRFPINNDDHNPLSSNLKEKQAPKVEEEESPFFAKRAINVDNGQVDD